jgi:sulfatase maturation enzyme AslB (radical SAM superfamily)
MSEDIAVKSIDFVTKRYGVNTGVVFFGGEPLLKKDLISFVIAY